MNTTKATYISILGHEIPFKIEKGKRGKVRLFYSSDNLLVVETGSGKITDFENEFIQSKAKWLITAWKENNRQFLYRQRLLEGLENKITLLGRETPVVFSPAEKTRFRYTKYDCFEVFAPAKYIEEQKKKLLFHSIQMLASQILIEHIHRRAGVCELKHRLTQTKVKDLTSKWGSCNSKGQIYLNWQLIFLEEEVIDYVIVHELMHLHEMNHGPKFKEWVAKYVPAWKISEKKLRENQWMIGILR